MYIKYTGDVTLWIADDMNVVHSITIADAFIRDDDVPESLLSVSDLNRCGFDVRFNRDDFYIVFTGEQSSNLPLIRMTGKFYRGTFQLPFRRGPGQAPLAMHARDPRRAADSRTTAEIVHRRFHAGRDRIKATLRLLPSMKSVNVNLEQVGECHVCLEANATKSIAPPPSHVHPKAKNELVYGDSFDMMTDDIHGDRYVFLYVDAYSRYIVAHMLARKSDALISFQTFVNAEEAAPKVYHCDGAGENTSDALDEYCREKGIHRTYSTPGEQYQNGSAESAVRLVSEKARALALQSGLPLEFWSYFVRYAVIILNHLLSSVTGQPPIVAHGLQEYGHRLRAFGCYCVVHQGKAKVENSKLSPRGIRAVFLGLGHDQGMRCWLALDPHTGHILKSNHVVFDETIFPLRNETIPQSLRQTELDKRFIQDMLDPKNGSGLTQPDAALDDVPPPACVEQSIDAPHGPVTRSAARSRPGPPRSILRSYAPGSGPQVGEHDYADDAGPPSGADEGIPAQVGATSLPTTRSRIKWSELSNEGPTLWHGTRGLNYWRRVSRMPITEVSDVDLVAWLCDEMAPNTGFQLPPKFWKGDNNRYVIIPVGPSKHRGIDYLKFAVIDPNPKHKGTWETELPISAQDHRSTVTVRNMLSRLYPHVTQLRLCDIKPIDVPHQKVTRVSARRATISSSCRLGEAISYDDEVKECSFRYASSLLFLQHYAFTARITTHVPLSAAPVNYRQACKRPDFNLWEAAMKKELDTLEGMDTWTVVDRPDAVKVLPTQWVYALKTDLHGNVTQKARVVVCGNHQTPDQYETTFSPTARAGTIRTLCAIAVQQGYNIGTFDIRAAFISALLPKTPEIYIQLPQGHGLPAGKVARLNRALYGLRNASATYHKKLHGWFMEHGFVQADDDGVLFRKTFPRADGADADVIIVSMFVDDGLSLYSNEKHYKDFMTEFGKTFTLSNDAILENEKYLGMQFRYDRIAGRLSICQSQYIESMLQRFGMADLQKRHMAQTPLEPDIYLSAADACDAANPSNIEQIRNYQQLVGSLLFLSCWGRPDITYATNQCARFMSCPGPSHFASARRILRYLARTKEAELVFERQPASSALKLECYVDADHAGDPDTRLSVSGYILMLSGGPVVWASRRQTISAVSSAESEWYAASAAALEIQYMRRLLEQLGFPQLSSTTCWEDNSATIWASTGQSSFRRLKHIDTRVHRLRQMVQEKILTLVKIPSADNISDVFTKSVKTDAFVRLTSRFMHF